MFLESLINGFATALAYLIVFGMMLLVSWKLGPRLYMRMMQSVTRDFMTTMIAPQAGTPPGALSPVVHTPLRLCDECSYGFDINHKFCPDCGAEVLKEGS